MKAVIVLLFAMVAVMSYHGAEAATTKPTTSTPKPTTSTPKPIDKCPKINGVYVDFLPHPTDCTSYYACETGTPILMHCPAGLHFNPILHVCDLPEHAKCKPV